MYTINTRFEWNGKKAESNAAKHGIDFKTACFIFDDPCALILEDFKHSAEEPRFWLIGDSGAGILMIVFTIRRKGESIRIISARKAGRRERRIYEKSKGV